VTLLGLLTLYTNLVTNQETSSIIVLWQNSL